MKLNQVGIAGEFRCVVTKADGEVKTDTGYQKNLILNQGLDFFGGGKGYYINQYCAIGSGNTAPAVTQTGLDAYIMQAGGSDITSDYSYVDTGDGLYRMWTQNKYRFEGLNNVNISEVGLVSTGTTSSDYYLTTRALIKDSLGNTTTITVLSGETLDIYYKIYKVIDTTDKSFVINVLDGNGGAVPYNAVVRPLAVGAFNNLELVVGTSRYTNVSTSELSPITATSGSTVGGGYLSRTMPLSTYVSGSYKRQLNIVLGLNDLNYSIRQVSSSDPSNFYFLPFQMRLGRVSDDAPLTKTSNDTLSIPLEFSWGRFEGVL